MELFVEAEVARLHAIAHVAAGLRAALDVELALDLMCHASPSVRIKRHGGAAGGGAASACCAATRVC